MARELNRYPGRKVRITFINGVVSNWITLNINHRVELEEAKASGSLVMQRVVIHEDADADMEFFNSAELNSANICANVPVEQFDFETAEAGNDSLLPSDFFTKFPVNTWIISESGIKQDDKSGRVTVKMAPNVLDLPASGGSSGSGSGSGSSSGSASGSGSG